MWLSFPREWIDAVVGTSCTGWSISGNTMLCGKTIGDADFSEYHNIMIPYCTQDVHMGDEPNTSYGAMHVGAHNLYRTLQWVFDNFPDPSHIFITGCSAGATPFPVVYDIINSHYSANGQDVTINGIADSPVFITPSYFLKNGIQHWNVGTIMRTIGFDFDSFKNDESFPNAVMDFVLDRSKETDSWGYVTHNADAVSLLYYSFMIGGTIFGGDSGLGKRSKLGGVLPPSRRRLNEDNMQSEWWMQMNNSMSLAVNDHDNFHSFVIEGADHCTFSLASIHREACFVYSDDRFNSHVSFVAVKNVPIQYKGFEEWASLIVQENSGIASTSNTADIDDELVLLPTESPIENASVLVLNTSALIPGMNSTSESEHEIPLYPNVQANSATYQPGDSSYGLLFLFMAILRYIM